MTKNFILFDVSADVDVDVDVDFIELLRDLCAPISIVSYIVVNYFLVSLI